MANSDDARPQLILLGASNLSLALPVALSEALARLPDAKLDIRIAHGPGRSYGLSAGVLGIRFPGMTRVIDRLLEDAVRAAKNQPVWALITDVGNDILYRAGVDTILTWVQDIASKLRSAQATVALTSLPVDSVSRMPSWKFKIVRPLLFPFRPFEQSEALSDVNAVQQGLEGIADSQDASLLPVGDWYGFDHFHLRRRARREALASWFNVLLNEPIRSPLRFSPLVRCRPRPVWRSALRLHRQADFQRQPSSCSLAHGVSLHAY